MRTLCIACNTEYDADNPCQCDVAGFQPVPTPIHIQDAPTRKPRHTHDFYTADVSEYHDCACGARRCAAPQCESPAIKDETLCRKHSKPQPFWNADCINEILSNPMATTTLENGKTVANRLIIYRFLQRMYERQTTEEQASFSTSKDNGIGFTGADARLLTDFAVCTAKYYREHEFVKSYALTEKQARKVSGRLRKYVKSQLVNIANESTQEMPEAMKSGTALAHKAETPVSEVPTTTKVADLKLQDPTKFYDPFDEGDRLSEEAATTFWTRRFATQPVSQS